MALIGCEWCGCTVPPKIHWAPLKLNMAPPTQEIALFLQGNIRTLMSGQKKGKKFPPYFMKKYTLYTITIK